MFKRISLALTALLAGVILLAPAPAAAQLVDSGVKEEACAGISATEDGKCSENADTQVSNVIQLAISILCWVVGIISVIMIIVSGIKYVTSSGDSNSVNSAKNSLLYAIIGLALVLVTQIIIQFVFNEVGQATKKTTNFQPLVGPGPDVV